MAWFRRRRKPMPSFELTVEPDEWVHVLGVVPKRADADATDTTEATATTATTKAPEVHEAPAPAPPTTSRQVELAPKIERALMALAAHARQMEDRVVALERRVDHAIDVLEHMPSPEDVLDVRLHSARVAADMTRVAVQLRAEIQETASQLLAPQDQKIKVLAEQVLALWDEFESLPREAPAAPPDDDTGYGPGIVAIA